jgi:hypothetical protein
LYENYMGGEVTDLERARTYLNDFVTRAGSTARYAESVTRARQHIRNIDQAITALRAVAQMNANPGPGGSTAPPAAGSTATPAGGAAAPAGGSSAPPANAP